jgi:prepilin-type N-terminal cleavage/methylation domain-containing protein
VTRFVSSSRGAARRGFTLIEILVVIAVILILASMMLVIRPANPEGLSNGQRMLSSMLRSARAQAMMNRAALPQPVGFTGTWAPAEFRYRVLIKNDPADPDRHLREMVIAIGFLGVGSDPTKYTWFSPDPAVMLPPGVMLVPPSKAVPGGFTSSTTTMPAATALTLSGTAATTRRSDISALMDSFGLEPGSFDQPSGAMMRFRPLASPQESASAVRYYNNTYHQNGSEWFYVEFGADGTSNHASRVMLVLAEGVATPGGVVFEKPDAFAAILLRRNGEVALTSDTIDFEEAALK